MEDFYFKWKIVESILFQKSVYPTEFTLSKQENQDQQVRSKD